MNIYNWPVDWLVDNFSPYLLGNSISNTALYTGAETTVSYLGEKWIYEFTLPLENMWSGADKEAFFNRLRGKANAVRFWHFARPVPRGTLRGSPKTKGAYQNVILWSQQFNIPVWNKIANGGGSIPLVTPNFALAPDGTNTADRIQFNRTTTDGDDYSIIYQHNEIAGNFLLSIYLKSNTNSNQYILFFGDTGYIELTVTPTWQRFNLKNNSTYNDFQFGIHRNFGVILPLSADVLVWQAQKEVGSIPTDPILTTSAPAYGINPLKQGSEKLRFQNCIPGQTLLAGDMIGVDPQVFQVAENCTVNTDGIIDVPVVNRTRLPLLETLDAVWNMPTCVFKLDSDSVAADYSTVVKNQTSVKFKEDF